ncbi:MAG: acyltransferase family protein [Gammaproteobacteria bacterium]
MIAQNDQPSARRYDIDALRVIAFGLLILYHCGMFYVAEWEWHVKSQHTAAWLQEPMRFLNQWRMSLLFVISGLAMSFVTPRYQPGQLALRRLWRLGLPLVFGMAVMVAPQPYYEALNKALIEPGFFRFWWQYLSFTDFPGEAWGGENRIVWTWNHLWYLPYVLLYTLVLLAGLRWLPKPLVKIGQWFTRLRGWGLIVIPLIPLLAYGNFVFPHFPFIDHGLTGDFYAHALYGTLFFYGYFIGRDDALWQHLSAWRFRLLAVAVVAYAALRAQEWWVAEDSGFLIEQLSFINVYLNRWCWILVLLAFGHRHLNRPAPWIRYATAAVFPWYILHQSITVTVGYELSALSLGPVVEPLLVVGLTILGCALLYEFVLRRSGPLRPLFGLARHEKPSRTNT